ncbi:MAG: hypothetical protein K2J49_00650 [Muribaculaceae bacterium]|nr:hypothetical protein [Muribaculaceae bacterium]MDE6771087.1 hypothetical protein [Muribaculaceae bacterium]
MNLKSLFSIAAAGLMLAACQNPEGKTLGQVSDASKADSLIYYFGQMSGADYQRKADSDTTLATDNARKEYISGVKAGLNAIKAGKDTYNDGLMMGMQIAMNMAQFKKDYGVTLSNKVYLESLAEAISSDSLGNPQKMQQEFYRIMSEFNREKELRDSEAASEALAKAAAAKNMSKISDNLYGNVAKNDGEKLKDGDNIKLNIKITDTNGKTVKAPMPSTLTIGRRMKESPLNEAFLSLSSGQNGVFLSSAQALFGPRCTQLGLQPDDVLTIDMTPTIEEPQDAAGQ